MASSLYSNDPKAVCDTHYFVYRELSQVGVVAIQLNLKMLVLHPSNWLLKAAISWLMNE
jgi:hypothetical protein